MQFLLSMKLDHLLFIVWRKTSKKQVLLWYFFSKKNRKNFPKKGRICYYICMNNQKRHPQISKPLSPSKQTAAAFLHKALVHTTGALGLLISISFFTATYDSALVKSTLLHMGGLLLAALWAALQITRRKTPFTKQNLPFLLPVFVYLGWNIICYIYAPYHREAAEEFIRLLWYGIITLLAATEFSFEDIKQITRWFLTALFISLAYAVVQILNIFFPGIDPIDWHGFFTKRIFSTHANPNFLADFLVFTSFLAAGVFLARRKKIIPLMLGLGIVALFFTESKGAWLAYGICLALGSWLYANCGPAALQKYRRRINVLALLALLGTALLAGVYTFKRFQSVSFRTHTWLATFEMIKESPVTGVGVGNFKTIYSAYRRPQIFYIEDAHNIETQHAENELLEQGAVSGMVGLAVFLWMLVFIFTLGTRTLCHHSLNEEKKYYLLGYVVAFGAIVLHSLVDVSVHFASTGFFFAFLMGAIIALCAPAPTQDVTLSPASPTRLVWGLRVLLAAGVTAVIIQLFRWFYEITSVLGSQTLGEVLLILVSWAIFVACLVAGAYVLLRAAWLLRSAGALGVLLLLLPLEILAYAPFQANHYYSLAVTFNNLANLEGSLVYFTRAIKFNPLQTEYYQFRANLLATRFDLTKRFSPARGDKHTPSDDYTRALQDYAVVEKNSPNHPLIHQNKGQLYYTLALYRNDQSKHARSHVEYELFTQEALDNMTRAKRSFERSLLADPVNPATYAYLIQIALLENNLEEAQRWIDTFRQGPAGVSEPEFLERHKKYPPIEALQAQLNARRKK